MKEKFQPGKVFAKAIRTVIDMFVNINDAEEGEGEEEDEAKETEEGEQVEEDNLQVADVPDEADAGPVDSEEEKKLRMKQGEAMLQPTNN